MVHAISWHAVHLHNVVGDLKLAISRTARGDAGDNIAAIGRCSEPKAVALTRAGPPQRDRATIAVGNNSRDSRWSAGSKVVVARLQVDVGIPLGDGCVLVESTRLVLAGLTADHQGGDHLSDKHLDDGVVVKVTHVAVGPRD